MDVIVFNPDSFSSAYLDTISVWLFKGQVCSIDLILLDCGSVRFSGLLLA